MTPIEQIKGFIEQGSVSGLEHLARLIGVSALVTERDPTFKRQALHFAARANRPEIVEWLIHAGADIEAQDVDLSTPLIVAAINGAEQATQALLAHHSQVNARRRDGKTAFIMAQSLAARGGGFSATAELLLRAGANTLAVDADGKTAMDHAEEISIARVRASDASRQPIAASGGALASALGADIASMGAQSSQVSSDTLNMNTVNDPFGKPKIATSEASAPDIDTRMPRSEAINKLRSLGFELLGAIDGEPSMEGRDALALEISTLLDHQKNVLLVGKPGVGKRSLARQAAETLAGRGKIVMSVPSSCFRGTKYAGSVNENIQKWLGPALSLGDELTLFINDAHQLSTGVTSSDSADTPLQILREQLDTRKERHLTLLCATTPKEVKILEDDEPFMRLFARKDVLAMSQQEALAAMVSPAGTRALLADHPQASSEDLARVSGIAVELAAKYLFNQSFPAKSFDFASRALAVKAPACWTESELNELFCSSYAVPREIADGALSADSPFYQLELELRKKLIGQDGPISEISQAIASQIVLADPTSHAPVTMLLAGPTGVGKTEATLTVAKTLGLPSLELSMGEFKDPREGPAKLLAHISDFCTKHYAGVILFDEIEKSNPQARDLLLNLFDKGIVGSGDDKVECGFMICVATTNVGAEEAVALKKELRELDGNPKIHDSWIRAKMINEGFRPEFINRIALAVDFNDITRPDALTIAKMMIASKAKALKTTRRIELCIDNSVAQCYAADVFDQRYGARGIRRCVDAVLQSIVSNRDLALAIGPGSSISATARDGMIIAKATSSEGKVFESTIKARDEDLDKRRLGAAQRSLSLFADSVLMAARTAETHGPTLSRSAARP